MEILYYAVCILGAKSGAEKGSETQIGAMGGQPSLCSPLSPGNVVLSSAVALSGLIQSPV